MTEQTTAYLSSESIQTFREVLSCRTRDDAAESLGISEIALKKRFGILRRDMEESTWLGVLLSAQENGLLDAREVLDKRPEDVRASMDLLSRQKNLLEVVQRMKASRSLLIGEQGSAFGVVEHQIKAIFGVQNMEQAVLLFASADNTQGAPASLPSRRFVVRN